MDTLIIVLKVGLVLYGIYSFIVYISRRSGNKSALNHFRTGPVLRCITDDEKSALQPFLMSQGLTADDQVRELRGAFLRHGLQTQGSSTEHDTISGVDVLLPYDALDYIEANNEALVVLSKKCAVVIRVNGFNLLEGRQRAQRQQAQDKQWKQGAVGALPNIDDIALGANLPLPGAAASAAADTMARFQRGEVDILAQRSETPEEVADRMGRGGAWVSALGWLAAFLLLWAATLDITSGVHAYLLGAGFFFALLAAWLFVRQPSDRGSARAPQPVNRVRGMLNQIAVVNASNVSVQQVGVFIGDKLRLVLPAHWRRVGAVPYGEVIEAELRTGDFSAVSFGDRWSVADEWRRFRPVYWGRHLLHLLIGLLAIGALVGVAPDLRGDAALIAQWLSHDEGLAYGDVDTLAANPPKWGSIASMEGEGRCEIDLRARLDGHAMPAIDCTRVRWSGQEPVVPALDIAQSVLELSAPDFIRGTENSMTAGLIAMLRMQMGQAPDPLAAYRAQESTPVVVRGFDRSVAAIELACNGRGGLTSEVCSHLQREVVRIVEATVQKEGVDTPVNTWAALAASAKPGQENADVVLSRSQLASVQRVVREAVDAVAAAKIEATIPSIVPATGGVLLASSEPLSDVQRKTGESADADVADNAVFETEAEAELDKSLLGRWARLQRLATADGSKHFVLKGLVTDVGHDATGATQVRVEPGLDATRTAAAGAHMLWWLFATILVLVNGALFAVRLTQDLRRGTRLQADIATRPAPGAAGLF